MKIEKASGCEQNPKKLFIQYRAVKYDRFFVFKKNAVNIINTDGGMIMEFKILGIVLVSLGLGMLIVSFFPWWGFIAAIIMVLAGVYLIIKKC